MTRTVSLILRNLMFTVVIPGLGGVWLPWSIMTRAKAREQRLQKYDRPPSWRGAFYRALAAAVLLLLFGLLVIKNTTESIALFPIVLAMYVPISYYTDMWLYKRRLKQKQAGAR